MPHKPKIDQTFAPSKLQKSLLWHFPAGNNSLSD